MGLKSKEWFYKQCLLEVDKRRPLHALSWNILMKGIAQQDKTRGHVNQAIGAAQKFFASFPNYRRQIAKSPPVRYELAEDDKMLEDWLEWFSNYSGPYDRTNFGYDFNTLWTYLTSQFGGKPKRGGGGDDEFQKVLRLVAGFHGRK